MSGMDRWGYLLGVAIASANTFNPHCALAQITPDRTLPNNSIVTPSGNINIITGGTQAGNNLFHSFQQFSIPSGSGAFFNNAVSIQNIISRVTGGSISNIDGFIRALGAANVFLLNPNGIIFGSNASLNVGGSFVATTANAIQFGNIGFFSADKPNASTPLLTINPSALLFNQLPTAITNRSQAAAGINPAGVEVTGLRVPDGKSLLLGGGNINVEGGALRAYGGRIELAGLAAPGVVGLNVGQNTLGFSVPNEIPRADISLTNAGEMNVRGADAGSIAINAQNFSFAGQSKLRAGIDTGLGTPQSKAGDIDINAKGATTLTDGSFIANVPQATSVGKGGNINITTGSLALINGSSLNTSNFGQGDGGNINLNVRDALTLAGVGQNGLTTTIFSRVQSQAVGKGGSLNIQAGSVSLADQAYLDASTSGKGDAGSIFIQASDSVSLKNSGIYSNVEAVGEGKGGDIRVATGSLSLTEGSEFNTKTLGQGNAGNIIINAREAIALDGRGDGTFSRIISSVNPEVVGNAGNIQLTAGSLKLTNGAFISSLTSGKGDAGNITIDARDRITFDGNSYANSSVSPGGVGKGGDIQMTTGSLSLTNGGQLNTNVLGQGNAGNITVDARDTVNLYGILGNEISGIQSSLLTGGIGKAGDILVTTGSLSVTNGAALSTSTNGQGNAGNISINARDTVTFDGVGKDNGLPSQASSTLATDGVGNGGDIRVNARALFLKNGGQLNANSFGQGNAGKITIDTRDTVAFDGVGSDGRSDSGAQTIGYPGNGGDIRVTTGTLSLTNGGKLSTYAQGNAGNITINARDAVNFDGVSSNRRFSGAVSELLSGGVAGKGGDIGITTGSNRD